MSPGPAALLLAAVGAAALLADRTASVAALAALLLAVCVRGAGRRALPFLVGVGATAGAVLVVTPFVETVGWHVLWSGPTVPVLGTLDVTSEALRGRGIEVTGLRGRARLVSPLLAGSLERGLNVAEAMEARGFGRAGQTRAPRPAWTRLDRLALASAPLIGVAGALWL